MSYTYDSFANRGEYLSAHYFSEELENTLKKKTAGDEGLFTLWTTRETDEHDPRPTPREALPKLRGDYLSTARPFFLSARANEEQDLIGSTYDDPSGEWPERVSAWHARVLAALGYEATDETSRPLVVYSAGREYEVQTAWHGDGIVALDCGWTASLDDALEADGGPGRLIHPLKTAEGLIEAGEKLAGWLAESELYEPGGDAPRFVLLLCGGVLVLADRNAWREGRYLAASLDAAFARNDLAKSGELALLAALFSHDMLAPRADGKGRRLDAVIKASRDNAVGVNSELRKGLQRSVEIIANEVLARLRREGLEPRDIEDLEKGSFARQLTRESLRYLYRVLFLLYAEARPELGILPADDSTYEAGYSVARLRELVARERKLVDEESRKGFHLYASLDVLFNKVNFGHRPHGTERDDHLPADQRSQGRGLRFEALSSELFDPKSITLIGTQILDPRWDEDGGTEPRWLDLRLRNEALHEVLRLLTMKEAGVKGRQGGFISYRNLGINQLGAVYEGLMSYTGIIADEELAEVAKPGAKKQGGKQYGDPEKGSWLIPAGRLGDYPENTWVVHSAQDAEQQGLRGPKKYEAGKFVYRLAGRDRETSASYYTPESLTQVTVELALKHRLTDETRASELLKYTICEPALGSGAFLNEAINQVADEYLKRRQVELGVSLDASKALEAKQKVKAYIALHNAYGIDLNATGVELAEVSLWLNTMHPGMRAPWFGLHLRRGNSLIGARRWVYEADRIKKERNVGGTTPVKLPFRDVEGGGAEQTLPKGAVHQFLLPTPGWGAVAGVSGDAKKLVEQLAGPQLKQLKAWKSGVQSKPKTTGGKSSQLARLQAAAERVEFLWQLVAKRMELSEREIARTIEVWGAEREEDAEEYAFLRRDKENSDGESLPLTKEQVFKDLFEAEGSPYWRLKQVMDAWCALWFWPLDRVGLLDGTDVEYETAPVVTVDALLSSGVPQVGEAEPAPEPRYVESRLLFALNGDQMAFDDDADEGNLVETKQIKQRRATSALKKGNGTQQRRAVIPLKELDDWIAFVESMVGTVPVPEATFATTADSLEELKLLEEVIQGEMGMDDARKAVETRYPWMRLVRDIAKEQGFLHWELDFAGVFTSSAGGFDLQVGNPPWVRPQWKENPVLGEHEPWFMLTEKQKSGEKNRRRNGELERAEVREYLLKELIGTLSTSSYLSASATYPLIAGTKPDLYRAFMCEVWDHFGLCATAGMVHPDTHFSGDDEARLREAAYRRLRLHGDFVNAGNRFFPSPVGRSSHFGVHVYGGVQEISFDSLSWLFTVDSLRLSFGHDGNGVAPGVKNDGSWDERPHRSRVIRVTLQTLSRWQKLSGSWATPLEQTWMLTPVSNLEDAAIDALSNYPIRMGDDRHQISPGLSETVVKEHRYGPDGDGPLIEYNQGREQLGECESYCLGDVILQGPQVGVSNPIFKQPSQGSGEMRGMNHLHIPDGQMPESEFIPAVDRLTYLSEQDKWEVYSSTRVSESCFCGPSSRCGGRASFGSGVERPGATVEYSRFYRMAWREWIAMDTERSLYCAVIPPGPNHLLTLCSATLGSDFQTVLTTGFWSSIPLDYMLRITGTKHLQPSPARRMPVPSLDHPLAPALLLRALRLNALTTAYADLWSDLYDPRWPGYEPWAVSWPGMKTELHAVTPSWQRDSPLRTEYARRAALVEIDALVAVWLGIDADTLVAMYRARFPIMQDFDRVTWFDATERKIAGDRYTYGFDQTKDHWAEFEAYQEVVGEPSDTGVLPAEPNSEFPEAATPPTGYTAPFYKANREREMRAAHAYFKQRLDAAVAQGLWDPETMEVPSR
ncbi:SAM-dependent methyltransferase [Streptomyces sp. NBC_00237]|uniref:hypothetical protein n=1 Tax=Streptomyces sp. NBC_00237 TaxID=2975687 RepID=UPI00225493C1|nr:hypothetical protein [Streptomyces sp. NBC_00237]MCX5206870.1 SAM-dependent methyltransferase [Streptomyces sp. NBC_00237]